MQLQQSSASALDISRIAPKLYMGSAPPHGELVRRAGFDTVVLCAREYQPRSHELPGVMVMHAGIDDSHHPELADIMMAMEASRATADLLMQGQRVLVTCWQGRNRSGLVTALALRRVYGVSGDDAVNQVQMHRSGALMNPAFVKLVKDL